MKTKAHIRALRVPEDDGYFTREPGTWRLVVENGFDDGPSWTDVRYYDKRRWADALHDALSTTGA